MNSINDLQEIYDELYRRGKAAARTALPDAPREEPDATNAKLLPAIAVQPVRAHQTREHFAALASAAAIVALTGGLVLAVQPWSHGGKTPAGAQASSIAPSAASPPSAANTTQPSIASSRPTRAETTANPALVGSSSARCYATADIGRQDNYFSITVGGKGSSPVAAGPLALNLCSNSWREGTLSTRPPYKIDTPADNGNLPVPKLVACVLPANNSDEGVQEVAILPGAAGTCSELGLSVFPGGH